MKNKLYFKRMNTSCITIFLSAIMVFLCPAHAETKTESTEYGTVTSYAYISRSTDKACVKSITLTGRGHGTNTTNSGATVNGQSLIQSGFYSSGAAGWTGYNLYKTYASGSLGTKNQSTTASTHWTPKNLIGIGGTVTGASAYANAFLNLTSVRFDNLAPNQCTMSSMSASKGGYNANGVFYAAPGATVYVTWSQYDGGCAGVSSPTYTSERVAPSSSGRETVSRGFCDTLGNCSANNLCQIDYLIDGDGPNCSGRTISQSTWDWTKGPVTVGASGCSDSGSGFKSCSSVNATGEDQQVTITCRDNLDNKTYVNHTVKNIDTSYPYCTGSGVSYRPTAGTYVRTAVPSWGSCGDARSGCTAGTYYDDISGGSGSIKLVDNVGNEGSCSISYDFWDGSAPTTKITFDSNHTNNSESEYTSDEKITVTISATDSGNAGVDRVCYKLEGETTEKAVCHKGNSYSFDISNEGITNITAWSFDKAHDYSNGGFVYNASTIDGGNKSADVKKNAYIDRTKPNLTSYTADDDGTVSLSEVKMALTSAYDDIKDEHPWINTPVIVTVDSFDTKYRDGSSSGLGSIEYYWGLTANPAEVWGAAHTNRKYNTSNNPTETIPTKALAGSDYKANNVPYNDRYDYTPSVSNPANNPVLNDELYLHVRVCDRATTYKGQKAPNCTTAVYGPVYYDDMPPNIVKPVVPPSDKTPTNPSTDPDNPTPNPKDPVGGTGSEIVEPTDIPTDATAMDSHDWTNKLVIAFSAYEHMQDSEVHTGKKANSGVDKIEFYYDRNYNHETATLNKSTHTVLDNYRQNCSGEKVCSYYLDFNSLSNYPDNNSYTVMEEGNRFIRVRVYDIAGNVQDFYFGPYRFDITPNTISNIEFSGQTGTMIDK